MEKTNGIYWLASYPKSGNTWLRIVLANILNKKEEMDDLEDIHTGAIASSRPWIDAALGFDSALLSADELEKLTPAIFKYHHEKSKEIAYHKIHNAYTYLDKRKRKPLIPTDACLGAIYILRNPLDVAISYANHSSCSLDQAIATLGNPETTYCNNPFEQSSQVRHQLCSWSLHVESWTTAKDLNLLVLRYEDMKNAPLDTFTKAMKFLRIEATSEQIQKAIDNANIEKLQEIEKKSGFKERPPKVEHFFRKGVIDDWKQELNSDQIRKIVGDHAVVMNKFGYMNETLIKYF